MKRIESWILLAALALVSGACSKTEGDAASVEEGVEKTEYFDFATTGRYDLTVDYDVPQGYRVLFEVYGENPLQTVGGHTSLRSDVKPLAKGYTDARGHYAERVVLPTCTEKVWVYTSDLGVPSLLSAEVTGTSVALDKEDSVVPESAALRAASTRAGFNYVTLGAWNGNGRPDYLSKEDEIPDLDEMLPAVNEVFKESERIRSSFLRSTDINVTEPANISVHFVASSTSGTNVLGYYCYPTGQKPSSPEEIRNCVIVFPNLCQWSVIGSNPQEWEYQGKAIKCGEAVKLRYIDPQGVDRGYDFPAGVSIGWILYHNGWNYGTLTAGDVQFYSDPDLNAGEEAEKRHMALFKLDGHIFFGFEDWWLKHEWASADGDYNDCVFHIGANPSSAIDSDIPDVNPEPEPEPDAEAYFTEYEGTLAFEDNWPSQGDYDMNDVVVKYHAKTYFNRDNEALRSEDTFSLVWCGCVYRNGFGYALPAAAAGAEVSAKCDGEPMAVSLEQGTAEPVVLLFDDARTATVENTKHPVYEVETRFANPIPASAFTPAPYNPFLTIRQRRAQELHLPMYTPTSRMDMSLFGLNKDKSRPDDGVYYVADVNYPFAIHIPGSDEYVVPTETKAIDTVYPRFSEWARSNGQTDKDWYLHPAK